jgi:hypothetical protein
MFRAALFTTAKLQNQPSNQQLVEGNVVLDKENGVVFSHKEE